MNLLLNYLRIGKRTDMSRDHHRKFVGDHVTSWTFQFEIFLLAVFLILVHTLALPHVLLSPYLPSSLVSYLLLFLIRPFPLLSHSFFFFFFFSLLLQLTRYLYLSCLCNVVSVNIFYPIPFVLNYLRIGKRIYMSRDHHRKFVGDHVTSWTFQCEIHSCVLLVLNVYQHDFERAIKMYTTCCE